jgi:hypothetical protein
MIKKWLVLVGVMGAVALVPNAAGAAGANDLSAQCKQIRATVDFTQGGCVAFIRSSGNSSADLSSACRDQNLADDQFGGNQGACVKFYNELFKGTGGP